jgi:lipopolysaccharide/colanic/teichoic acid biosynthesis glycosyltransferase
MLQNIDGQPRMLATDIAQKNATFYFLWKRTVDIVVSATLLVLFSPLMLLIAILIKLDTSGPAIFSQQRVGARRRTTNGRTDWEVEYFSCYKFRSMVANADAKLHQAYVQAFIKNDNAAMAAAQGTETHVRKLVKDPRITRVGKWLRKSSLDELPQLWNILKGDMSLVGPRPSIPYEVETYEPWHRRRLDAKPGLTGLWQVTARSSANFDEAVELDIEYIDRQSIWLDLWILVKTPLAVLASKGAM